MGAVGSSSGESSWCCLCAVTRVAAALDQRLSRIWLDRTPPTLASALDQALNTNLFDALIPGFLLHWDLPDLACLAGNRLVQWTDPIDWAGRPWATG